MGFSPLEANWCTLRFGMNRAQPSSLTSALYLTFFSFDYSGKRIGVIGGGSSAIQIVPQLQKLPETKLSCFIRSKTWISATFGAGTIERLGLNHNECKSCSLISFPSLKVQQANE